MKQLATISACVAAVLIGVGCYSSSTPAAGESKSKDGGGIFSPEHIAYMATNALRRFDKPMTYSQATKEKDINFPFPKSAKNIQFGVYSFWQAYGLAVRFNAPVDDCLILAHGLMEKHSRSSNQPLSYSVVSVTNVVLVDPGLSKPVSWFTSQTIRRGLQITSTNFLPPRIWIDLDTQTFYLNETD